MKDLIQLSMPRHDDHDNPFLQKQATPGPSRQQQQQQPRPSSFLQDLEPRPTSTSNSNMGLNMDMSFDMPSPIPVSKHAADHRRVESDLNRNLHTLQGLTDDEFDSDHTFSRLGGFGKDSQYHHHHDRHHQQATSKSSNMLHHSRSLMHRQPGFETDESSEDDGMNLSRGTEVSSFDAHARRSGLPMPAVPIHLTSAPVDLHEHQHFQHHPSSSSSPSSTSISTNSIELARTAPTHQQTNHPYSPSREMDDLERSFFVGASPVSTLGHHVSGVTFGVGIFGNGMNKGRGVGGDVDGEGDEYDPERRMEGLIEAVKVVGSGSDERGENVFSTEKFPMPTNSSQRSIFAPHPSSTTTTSAHPATHQHQNPPYNAINPSSQRHLHRPVQPSPLRVQANLTVASTMTGSGSGSASLNQSKSLSQRDEPRRATALGEQNKLVRSQSQNQSTSQSARSNNHAMDGGRKIMAPLEGVDNVRSVLGSDRRTSGSAGKMMSESYAPRHASKGDPEGFTPSPRVRIISADHQGEKKSDRVMRSTSTKGQGGPGHATTMGDLTGLTGMLATPAKGLLYRRLGEDGERSGQGADIESALRKMEVDMNGLKRDTATSRSRIRDLELELEKARIDTLRAERDAEVHKGQKRGLEDEVERLRDEKMALESLVDALRKDVSRLEANLEKEIGRVHMVQQEMQKRSPAKATVQMPVTELADLFPLVNHLNKKVDGLEAEVARLKHVVEDAYERTIGEIRPEATRQQRRVVSDEAERPPSRAHTEPERRTQYAEGVQTAAYHGTRSASPDQLESVPTKSEEPRKTMLSQMVEDDGDSSPSPRSRIQGDSRSNSLLKAQGDDSNEVRRSARKSVHDSRSEEPQEDPASSPFPAIRGDKLEREFFSPASKATANKASARSTKHLAARVEDADEVDEGYGGEEIVHEKPVTLVKVRSQSARHEKQVSRYHADEVAHELDGGKVPPQTNVMKVLRELEDDYKHYLSIYTDLAEQYGRMGPLSTKRNVLAEHLKEVIDTMEQKANQVACLTEVLEVRDKPYMAPVIKAARASKARMSVPETVRAIRKDLGHGALSSPAKITPRRRSGRYVAIV